MQASTPIFVCADGAVSIRKNDDATFTFSDKFTFRDLAVFRKSKTLSEAFYTEDGIMLDEFEPITMTAIRLDEVHKTLEFLHYHEARDMPAIQKPLKSDNVIESMEFKDQPSDFYKAYLDSIVNPKPEYILVIVQTANFFAYEDMLNFLCAGIAATLKNRTPKEIRSHYTIEEPTPQEEEETRKNNAWIFDVRPASEQQPASE